MALDMFMKIGKDVGGESIDSKHPDEIQVLAWSWGMSQAGSMHDSTGGGAGKVNVQDLSFTKYVDVASHRLKLALVRGDHFDDAILTVRKAGGAAALEYLKVTMKNVIVTSLSDGGSGGEDRLTENVTLNFAEFEYVYQAQDEKGAAKGGEKTATWKIAKSSE